MTLVVVLMASGVAGCRQDRELPGRVVYEGEYLRYSTTVEGPICRGTFVVQEEYVRRMAELLDFEAAEPIQMARIGSAAEGEEYCLDERILSCYAAGIAYSNGVVSFHELAHAVAGAAGVRGPTPFQEGFAETFSNGLVGDDTAIDLDALLKDFPEDHSGYYTATLFVRFLMEEYGASRLLEFMRRTDRYDSYETWVSRFAESMDVSLSDAVAAFAAYPTCSRWQNRDAIVECGAAPVPWDGDEWSVQVELDCGRDDVLGPYPAGGRDVVWSERAVDIDRDGEYLIVPTGDAAAWGKISLTRCGSCWDALEIVMQPAGEAQWVALPAGRYHLLVARGLEAPETAGVVIRRAP